jgi:hypothetical protein
MTSTAAGITVNCRVTGDTDIQLGTPTLSSKVLFEKLALLLPQLVKKFPLFYGSQMFITVFIVVPFILTTSNFPLFLT